MLALHWSQVRPFMCLCWHDHPKYHAMQSNPVDVVPLCLPIPSCRCSADGTARVYNTLTGVCTHTLIGHEGEISKVSFNPQV